MSFNAKSGQTTTINGFSSKDVRVFDVTDERSVQELAVSIDQAKDGYAVTVTASSVSIGAPGLSERKLLALTDERALRASSVKANSPSHLLDANNTADFIIISGAGLIDSLIPLADLRRKQGLISALVDIEDVYDEFSFGNKSPQSVRDFISYAAKSWRVRPRFVLFAGDASYDARNYLGLGDNDLVPTKLIDTTFEQAATSLRMLLPPDLRVSEIIRSRTDDATARTQLLEAINRGQKIVNYTGHGSVNVWRGVTSDDGQLMENSNRLSLFVTMT